MHADDEGTQHPAATTGGRLDRRNFLTGAGVATGALLEPLPAAAAVVQGPPYHGLYYGCLSSGDCPPRGDRNCE